MQAKPYGGIKTFHHAERGEDLHLCHKNDNPNQKTKIKDEIDITNIYHKSHNHENIYGHQPPQEENTHIFKTELTACGPSTSQHLVRLNAPI